LLWGVRASIEIPMYNPKYKGHLHSNKRKCDSTTVSRSARLHCKSNSGAFWPSIFKTNVCYGVNGLVFRSSCATSNTCDYCTETSENVTERPFLGRHGSIAWATVAHFWPSIFMTDVCYGVYGLVFRSPCATSNTSAFCTETSKNVTERPFLGQHGSIAWASLAPFWPSIYKTHVCYEVYELVFRSPCET
jgi:hypothetical protein